MIEQTKAGRQAEYDAVVASSVRSTRNAPPQLGFRGRLITTRQHATGARGRACFTPNAVAAFVPLFRAGG